MDKGAFSAWAPGPVDGSSVVGYLIRHQTPGKMFEPSFRLAVDAVVPRRNKKKFNLAPRLFGVSARARRVEAEQIETRILRNASADISERTSRMRAASGGSDAR